MCHPRDGFLQHVPVRGGVQTYTKSHGNEFIVHLWGYLHWVYLLDLRVRNNKTRACDTRLITKGPGSLILLKY